ncbi:MAG: putative nucleotide-diphospho-sugar transferase [bacterium]
MKLCIFYTKEYEPMRTRFRASLQDSYEVVEKLYCYERALCPGGGIPTWLIKTEYLIDLIESNMGECIVYSDIDILFFGKTETIIQQALVDADLVFQQEYAGSGVNIGFFAMRCNADVLQFWKAVLRDIRQTRQWDQAVVNRLLYHAGYPIKWGRLPPEIHNCTQGGDPGTQSYASLLRRLRTRLGWRNSVKFPAVYCAPGGKRKSRVHVKLLRDRQIILYHANIDGHCQDAMQRKLRHLDCIERYMRDTATQIHGCDGNFTSRLGLYLCEVLTNKVLRWWHNPARRIPSGRLF